MLSLEAGFMFVKVRDRCEEDLSEPECFRIGILGS